MSKHKSNIETKDLYENKVDRAFLLPKHKPITYKNTASKQALESKILSKKDYKYAQEVFLQIMLCVHHAGSHDYSVCTPASNTGLERGSKTSSTP